MNQAPTGRTRLKRLHERGSHDAKTIHAILDGMPVCHVGYVFDGAPFVTPTFQWREGNHVYWHGSSASRMLETCEDSPVCLTVSIIDGMVMARSAFHHSCNYRSVMVFGTPRRVSDPAEKTERLKNFTERLYPGRWDMLRPVTKRELKATMVLSMPLDECSAKIRTGPPVDDEEDYALPIWAGVVPLRTAVLPPVDDPRVAEGIEPPAHAKNFRMG
jgi:hypothetical protein